MMINKLKTLLASRNVLIKDMVKETGLSRNTISNIVNNPRANIATATVSTICIFLGIKPDELFEYYPYTLQSVTVDIETEPESIHYSPDIFGKPINFPITLTLFLYQLRKEVSEIEMSGNINILYFPDRTSFTIQVDFSNDTDFEEFNKRFSGISQTFRSTLNRHLLSWANGDLADNHYSQGKQWDITMDSPLGRDKRYYQLSTP